MRLQVFENVQTVKSQKLAKMKICTNNILELSMIGNVKGSKFGQERTAVKCSTIWKLVYIVPKSHYECFLLTPFELIVLLIFPLNSFVETWFERIYLLGEPTWNCQFLLIVWDEFNAWNIDCYRYSCLVNCEQPCRTNRGLQSQRIPLKHPTHLLRQAQHNQQQIKHRRHNHHPVMQNPPLPLSQRVKGSRAPKGLSNRPSQPSRQSPSNWTLLPQKRRPQSLCHPHWVAHLVAWDLPSKGL